MGHAAGGRAGKSPAKKRQGVLNGRALTSAGIALNSKTRR
ncbi:hypothetical protein D083_0860 [Dickeya solani RNS 08.23.3.1.A]|nr:hypothetical protein D083_0860 [Dickeya solani RNS 08.23.3.1.A]